MKHERLLSGITHSNNKLVKTTIQFSVDGVVRKLEVYVTTSYGTTVSAVNYNINYYVDGVFHYAVSDQKENLDLLKRDVPEYFIHRALRLHHEYLTPRFLS